MRVIGKEGAFEGGGGGGGRALGKGLYKLM